MNSKDYLKQFLVGEPDVSLPETEQQKRVILAFSLKSPHDMFTDELFEDLGLHSEILDYFRLESLFPVPIVSVQVETPLVLATSVREFLSDKNARTRFVAIQGEVSYGIIRSGNLRAYGSTGVVMTQLLKCLLRLPLGSSWCDTSSLDSLELRGGTPQRMEDRQWFEVN